MEKHKILVLISFLLLQGCGERFYEQRPFDVSKPNQIFRSSFVVEEEYDYRFALIFDWSEPNTNESRDKQSLLIGRAGEKGVVIPLILTTTKDGVTFLDQAIQTDTSWSLDNFCYNKKTGANEPRIGFWRDLLFKDIPCESSPDRILISGPARTLDIRTLPPGDYQVEIRTLIPAEEFADMDTFMEISPYRPKI